MLGKFYAIDSFKHTIAKIARLIKLKKDYINIIPNTTNNEFVKLKKLAYNYGYTNYLDFYIYRKLYEDIEERLKEDDDKSIMSNNIKKTEETNQYYIENFGGIPIIINDHENNHSNKLIIVIDGLIYNSTFTQNLMNLALANGYKLLIFEDYLIYNCLNENKSAEFIKNIDQFIKQKFQVNNILVISKDCGFIPVNQYLKYNTTQTEKEMDSSLKTSKNNTEKKVWLHVSPCLNLNPFYNLNHNVHKLSILNLKRKFINNLNHSRSKESIIQNLNYYYIMNEEFMNMRRLDQNHDDIEINQHPDEQYFFLSKKNHINPIDMKEHKIRKMFNQKNIFYLEDYSSFMKLTSSNDPLINVIQELIENMKQ